jgi:phosphatidylethanolamine-binding protein (PEBP) family uncharacterized protein
MADYDAQDQIIAYFQLADSAMWNPLEFAAQDQIISSFPAEESAQYNPLFFFAQETVSQIFTPPATPGPTTYYAMRAIDPDCPTLTYVSWVVENSPDITGSQYTGARCGASPLIDITITAKWQE